MEWYRSGRNETDSKSVEPQGSVGSNPTHSVYPRAINRREMYAYIRIYFRKRGNVMYMFKSRVRYSEVDSNCLMKLSSIVNYMQDCSNFHSQDIGITVDSMKKEKKAWYLTSWQIEIIRRPELFEHITIGTLAYGFDAFFGYRNFFIKDEKDNIIVKANSIWVYMDLNTMRPYRIDNETAQRFGIEDKLDMNYESRKIKRPEVLDKRDEIRVTYEQIDTNGHMNNEQYISVAYSQIPYDTQVKTIRAEYKISAKLDDIIVPYVVHENDVWTVELRNLENKLYAIVQFL